MANPGSSSTPLENNQVEFGSLAWISEQLSDPLAIDADANEEAWFAAESKRISEMITKLENGLVNQKDKEINQLKAQLERKTAEIFHFVKIIVGLKKFLVCESQEFGKFFGNLVAMGKRGTTPSGPVLNVGPFKDEIEMDEFLKLLNELSMKTKDGVEKGNVQLLQKINDVLLKSQGLCNPIPSVAPSTTTNDIGTTIPVPDIGASVNQVNAFILTPGMPNRAIPAYRGGGGFNASSVFTQLERGDFDLLNSSVLNAKHGVDLAKLDKGHFCTCGIKCDSAESLGQHLILSID